MEVNQVPNRNKSNDGPTFTKYTLFLLNAVFVITSVLIISTAASTRAAFEPYYHMSTYGLDTLTTMWLVVGFILLMVAVFGIFIVFKESTALANIYAILMILVIIFQITAVVVSFPPTNETPDWATFEFEVMMRQYSDVYRVEIDWIQSKFHCCGIDGPDDWKFYDRFNTAYVNHTYTDTDTSLPLPVSCCENTSNYVDLMCEHYHEFGCRDVIYQIVSASVMLAGTFGLTFSVVQLSGIVFGFYYARILRSKKTQRDLQIWNTTDQRNSVYVNNQPPDYSTI